MRKVFLLSLIFLCACAEDTFPKYVQLGGLRILAIKALNGTAAEFSPGDSVTVTPLISDFNGGTRTLSYVATACSDPGISTGVDPSCDGVSDAVAVSSGSVTFAGGSVERTGEANSFTVTIPTTVLIGRSAVQQYNGVSYLLTYTLTASDGATTRSFRRLLVSAVSKVKNQNPTLSDLQSNGASLTTLPAADVLLGVTYPAATREAFSYMKSDGSLLSGVEDLVTTYFITDGILKNFRTVNDATTTYTPAAPVGHTAVIVAVMRDERGGVSYVLRGL